MNKVELIGRVGKDPDVRETRTGKKVARFSLAVNERFINGMGDSVQNTNWLSIVVWNDVISKPEDLIKKGACLYVQGKINNRSYLDKDGQKKYVTEIIGSMIEPRVAGQDQGVV